ncbi:MAG: hypothetical protein ACRCYY_05000 [Trueperaceae bacterium]
MEYYLITDGRISPVTTWLTPLDLEDVRHNQEQFGKLKSHSVKLRSNAEVRVLARFLTAATLLVEVAVAVTFLLPTGALLRDITLSAFIVSCYLIITVPPFGMILSCLGFAQSTNSNYRMFYQVTCVLMPLIMYRYYFSL